MPIGIGEICQENGGSDDGGTNTEPSESLSLEETMRLAITTLNQFQERSTIENYN